MSKKKSNPNVEVTLTINDEPVIPNETLNGSPETEIIMEPEVTPEVKEEKPPALEVDLSYAHDLADRIIASRKSGNLKNVGVAQADFEQLSAAGLIKDGLLKGSKILVLIQIDADTTNTYWNRTEE